MNFSHDCGIRVRRVVLEALSELEGCFCVAKARLALSAQIDVLEGARKRPGKAGKWATGVSDE